MPKVVGVKFRTSPRVYYFAPKEGEEYAAGSTVVVETQRGVEYATVVMPEFEVTEDKIVAPLKPIERLATDADLEALSSDNEKKQEIIATAKQRVQAHGLDMKIVDCEFTVDHGKLVLYFTAEQRVDFRELVRDLASAFHMRIDLRQIGSRDECKLIGSLGACGMPCCCKRFESDSEHVSIKMAKNQGLALNPTKINGMCGRLMCCLSYENKTYEDIIKRMPKHGAVVTAPDGRRGTVVSSSTLAETVKVRFGDDDNFEFGEFPLSELAFEKRAPQEDANKNNGNGQSKKDKKPQDGDRQKKKNKNFDRKDKGGKADNGGASGAESGTDNNFDGKPRSDRPPKKKNKKFNRNKNGNAPQSDKSSQ